MIRYFNGCVVWTLDGRDVSLGTGDAIAIGLDMKSRHAAAVAQPVSERPAAMEVSVGKDRRSIPMGDVCTIADELIRRGRLCA